MSRVYTTTPVAYNPNSPISGTLQIGNLAVGTDSSIDYSQDYGGLKWWMSPDQNDSYVIATQIPAGNEPVPNGVTPTSASVGFYKTVDLTDQSFINLVNWISRGAYGSSINDATTWLSNNGYWTSYVNTGSPSIVLNQNPLSAGDTATFTFSNFTPNVNLYVWIDGNSYSNDVFKNPIIDGTTMVTIDGSGSGTFTGVLSVAQSGGTFNMYFAPNLYSGDASHKYSNVVVNDSNQSSPTTIAGHWFLYGEYVDAEASGMITFPDHENSRGDLNPNHVGDFTNVYGTGTQLYINMADENGDDYTSDFNNLTGKTGTLTLIQGSNQVTYAFTSDAFSEGMGQITSDWVYGPNPQGSLRVIKFAENSFNTGDTITISYTNTIVNTSHVFLPQDGLPWTNYGNDGEGHSYLSVGLSVENSANLPQAGWYFIDDNDTVCQLLDTPVWFSNGAPSPYPNGTGWICVVDRICTFQDNNTNITFFEHVPTSFTIDSSMLDGLASMGNPNYASANGTAGFTVAQAVSEIYNGVYGTLTSGYGDINMVYSIAGITGYNGYICNVVWGSGSTIKSGLAKVGYVYDSNQVYIQSVDPTDNNFLNNDINSNNGTCLVGTFNFPATFTLLGPLDNKGGWC